MDSSEGPRTSSLLPPTVVGPLSTLNTEIEVTGQVVGATVSVHSSGHLVASGTATSADQVFPLLTGAHLAAGDLVTSVQVMGTGTPSAASPHPVKVQAPPSSLGHVTFASAVIACTTVVEITGAVPGAIAEVGVESGGTFHVRGKAESPDGNVGVFLNAPTQPSDTLVARQRGGGMTGPTTSGGTTVQVSKVLPTLTIQPLLPCETFVVVDHVVPGTLVTVNRTSVNNQGYYVSDPSSVAIDPPLVANEDVSVTQSFPACGYTSEPAHATVGAAGNVPAPVLHGALCSGSGAVVVTGLIPGALVRFFSGAAPLGDAQAPSASYTFALPALTAGAEITAKQQLCSTWSAASNGLTVGAHPTGGTPKISGPLGACAGAVRVLGVQAGNWVQVLSSDLAGPIGQGLATATSIDLAVAPQLIKGDHITARVTGCGSTVTSAAMVVGAAPTGIKPPQVQQTVEGQESITVISVDPGAFVEVFVNNVPRSSGFAAVSAIVLPLSSPLAVGDRVKALQRMCTVVSSFSPVVTTVPPPPTARFTAVPTSGIKPLSVQFTDQSTGESIDKWKWSFDDPDSPDPTSPLQNPSHTFQTVQTCTVTLQAGNAGGWSAPFSLPVDVLPPPPQATAKAAPPVGSAPQVVQFSVQPAPGSVITSYAWDFGDPAGEGPNTSSDSDPQHTYTQLGTFNPTLTIANAGGSTTVTVNTVEITQS